MSNLILEIAAFNFESALIAANAGAHRIELCDNALEGGTTPSYGMLKQAIKAIPNTPVFPMLRARGGDFVYSDHEFAIMQLDLQLIKELGFPGAVLGILNTDKTIDAVRCKELVELAYPMEISFHKAFDQTPDKAAALETLIEIGFSRVLTSGHVGTAMDGAQQLNALVEQANHRIEIVVGGSVRSTNVQKLAQLTGANEFHSAAVINKEKDTVANVEEVKALLKNLADYSL
jgi:copper homeostasis protein